MPPDIERAIVIGAGSAGRRHLRNLRALCPTARLISWRLTRTTPDAELTSIADRIVYDEAAALAERPQIVIVAGPATTHVNTALPFARAGVPLLVEKPLAADLEDADRLIAACRAQSTVLLVGYMLRFYPLLGVLAELLAAGRIGRPLGLRAEVGQFLPDWRSGSDWRQSVSARADLGGGALLEISHEIDYVLWLMGEVTAVGAIAVNILGLDVEDYAEVILRFASGAVGSVHLDMIQRPMVRCCRVIGENGTLELDFLAHVLRHGDASGAWVDLHVQPGFDRNDMFVSELRHFLMCAADGAEPQVTGEAGRRALQLALAARRAAADMSVVHV